MHYYRRFIGDYARDTKHLSFAEHGAYSLMLDWCYDKEKPLPPSKKEIYRLLGARTPEEELAIYTVLREFFVKENGGYFQKKVSEEISRFYAKSEVNSLNGRKGGLLRQANARNSLDGRLEFAKHPQNQNQNQNQKEHKERARRKSPALPIPEHYSLSEPMRAFATGKGMTLIEDEFAQFCSRHRSKGSVFVDWEQAWQTWVFNWIKFGGQNGKSQGSNRNTGKLAAETGKQYRQPTVLRA